MLTRLKAASLLLDRNLSKVRGANPPLPMKPAAIGLLIRACMYKLCWNPVPFGFLGPGVQTADYADFTDFLTSPALQLTFPSSAPQTKIPKIGVIGGYLLRRALPIG